MIGVFHKIGEPTEDKMTHSIKQILNFDGTITFDGIYESVFDHRIVLAKRKPILFITGNKIGREGFCHNIQLGQLKNLGFILAWHGWSHRKLTELSKREVMAELDSGDNPRLDLYAYPHGEFDDRVKKLVKQMGYKKAYSTTQGDDSDFAIRREYI